MPCTSIFNQQGTNVGIICSHSTARRKRCVCGALADWLCGYPLAKKDCDKGVCERCGLHLPYQRPLGEGLFESDAWDYCAEHKDFVFPLHERRIFVVNSTFRLEAEKVDRTTRQPLQTRPRHAPRAPAMPADLRSQ